MKNTAITMLLLATVSTAAAAEPTWQKDVAPLIAAKCGACHGPNAPEYNDWMQLGDEKRSRVGPRMDTYPHFMSYVVWPATGAIMRRLDDGKTAGGKPGNMYAFLGANEDERAKNLAIIKEWLGEGAWNANRWKARGDVPGVTKDQLEKVKAKY